MDAAAELIRNEPFRSISIRKIADSAGFHNSTIYSYFQDADWLLALSSVRYLQPYSDDLMKISRQELTPIGHFYAVWNCFCAHSFANPSLFYNFFFGKYREHLTDLLDEYYVLFPDARNEHSPLISDMFHGNTMRDRCLSLLKPLCGDPWTRVSEDNINDVNFIIVSTLEEFLSDLVRERDSLPGEQAAERSASGPEAEEADPFVKKYVSILHFIIDR